MRKLFVFAVLFVMMTSFAQAQLQNQSKNVFGNSWIKSSVDTTKNKPVVTTTKTTAMNNPVATKTTSSVTKPASSVNTIDAGKVTNQPVHKGKVVNIAKGDSALISGVDSLVVVKNDSASKSDKVKIYAGGKVKFEEWLKEGYTTKPDPADTTGKKLIIIAMGGDDEFPQTTSWISRLFMNFSQLSLFWQFMISLFGAGGIIGSIIWWKRF